MTDLAFQINDWILVVDENRLCRDQQSVSLEPRLVNLLCFLAQHPHQVFSRDTLIEQVWSGAFVSEQVVTQSIFELRKILKDGDSNAPVVIATVPKRGYQLVADVARCDYSSMEESELKSDASLSKSSSHASLSTPLFAAPASQAFFVHRQESTPKTWWKVASHWCLLLTVLVAFAWQISPISQSNGPKASVIVPNMIAIEIPIKASLNVRGFAVALQAELSQNLGKTVRLLTSNQDNSWLAGTKIDVFSQGDSPKLQVIDGLTRQVLWQGMAQRDWWSQIAEVLRFSPKSSFINTALWSSVGAWSTFELTDIDQGLSDLAALTPSANTHALTLLLESEKVALLHHGLLTPQWRQSSTSLSAWIAKNPQSAASSWVRLASSLQQVYQNNGGVSTPQKNNNTPWEWIIKGKQAELLGQSQHAQRDYMQAYYLFPDPAVMKLAQSLAFYSQTPSF